MIRKANKYDKTEVIEMMQQFRQESGIEFLQNIDNQEYWSKLFDTLIAGMGVIFIEQGKGLIIGVVNQSIWCDKTFSLHELAWWVKPEYRGSSVGYKLFKAFLDYGEELKQQNRITHVVMAKLSNSPDFDYGRFGFKKTDESWTK